MGRILALLFTVALLFGCGGEDKVSQAPATMPENGSDTGVVLNERAALSISNSYLRVQAAPGVSVESTLETDCEGQTCTLTEPRTGISESISLQDLETTDADSIENLRQVVHFSLTKRDVAVYGGSVGFELGEGSSVHATAFGGWMVYNYFLAALGRLFRYDLPVGPSRCGAFHRQRYRNASCRGCHL